MGWCLEAVQRCTTSGAESGGSGLAAQGLSALSFALSPVAYVRMEVRICDPIVQTGAIRTGEPLGGNPFGRTAAAFPLRPGDDRGQVEDVCVGTAACWRQAGQS
jgi:hypothetical protein